jgi:LacI family transcriptional regulator
MVSMKDIARRCGVSVATVSKALNGLPDIGEETRQKICAMAAEMGYMTNSAARALKTKRTYNLGILFVDERRSGLSHEYFSSILEGFKQEAEAHGYDITFINSHVGDQPLSYLRHCRYRGLDGVLIACVNFHDPRVVELVQSNIPVATIDHIFPDRQAILSDNVDGLETLVRYAYNKGHRRIAFLHGEDTSVTKGRLTGFYKACGELGIDVPSEYVIPCVYHDPDRCREATRRLLRLPEPPTCIIFPDDYSFMGGYNTIVEEGLRFPEDISALGYDGINLARLMNLTTYTQNAMTIGRTSAQHLIAQVEGTAPEHPEPLMIHGGLMEGLSVKPL